MWDITKLNKLREMLPEHYKAVSEETDIHTHRLVAFCAKDAALDRSELESISKAIEAIQDAPAL